MTDSTDKLTKTEIKAEAKLRLLQAIGTAFYPVYEDGRLSKENAEIVAEEMDKQMERVEKMFGYVPGSFFRS